MNDIEIKNKISELIEDLKNKQKETQEIELKLKRNRIMIKKIKNQIHGLRLDLEEIETENWKEKKKQKLLKRNQKGLMYKYGFEKVEDKELREELYSQYYSQNIVDKCIEGDESAYIEKNIIPYID